MPEHGNTPKKDAPLSPSVARILDTCRICPEDGFGTKSLAALWRDDIVSIADILSQCARDPILESATYPELCAATRVL